MLGALNLLHVVDTTFLVILSDGDCVPHIVGALLILLHSSAASIFISLFIKHLICHLSPGALCNARYLASPSGVVVFVLRGKT